MTKTLRRIEVEPLSEPRWSKIERGLFARLERAVDDGVTAPVPRLRNRVVSVGLIAAALGALALVVLVVSGLPDRDVIDHPSRITTGASASHLALPGLSLDVEPQSAVVIDTETRRGQLIVLDRGTIVCRVAPRSSATPLIVQVGATRVRVIGTRFRVTRLGEAARVQVQEGVVEVTSRGGAWRVQAGEEWPLAEPEPDETLTQKPLTREPGKPLDESPAADRAIPEKGASRARSRSTASARTGADEAEANIAPPDSTPVQPGPSSQAVFERATSLERSDPARASQLYRSLESGGDSWAQNALYARARLAAARGNAGEARRLLERYLQRFPRGSNAEDARAVLRGLR